MACNVLVVDDESDIREMVAGILEDNGYIATVASSYIEADESIRKARPNLVILDVWLGDSDRDGLRLLDLIIKNYEYVPVIMISGHGTIETAISAIKQGAYDFIEKPFDSKRLITSVEKAVDLTKLQMENADLKVKAQSSDEILGQSRNMQEVRRLVTKFATESGRCVILGAPGSDKETVAKEIHKLSARAKNPFYSINCRSYNSNQLDIELFGSKMTTHETSMISVGALEKANGGTMFIDELNYASPQMQQKLLDVLKQEKFSRIGSDEKIPLDIRVIAGLPLDIENLVKSRIFNEELYYRINANVIKILPLNNRREDIKYLLEYYMDKALKAHNLSSKKFSNAAVNFLCTYQWFGDVMQMKNMIDWVLTVTCSGNDEKTVIEIDDLPKEMLEGEQSEGSGARFISSVSDLTLRDARESFEKEYFIAQLKRFDGNISNIAKFVGMERSALHRKLKSLGIDDSKSYRKSE